MNEKKIKLPSLSKVKKALYADWALRVKQRDGWKCLLCGCTDNLTAHHWYVSDHHAHAARYCVDNGVTLCYACHIRSVHTRADWVTVDKLYTALLSRPVQPHTRAIAELSKVELTVPLLRSLWDEMRARVIDVDDMDISEWCVKGSKFFMGVALPRPIAIVGNVVQPRGLSKYEVAVVTPFGEDGYRYTLKGIEE